MTSLTYLMPFPLYGSGLRSERISAAIWPTSSLLAPRTATLVWPSTSKVMPAGKTLAAASTLDATVKGDAKRTKVQEAAEVGTLVAQRAKAAGVAKVVFDRAGFKYHGRLKALADAARAAGLEF